jgi:Flp pilus assembly protein TadB
VTFVVLFILAVVWALYLASWLRTRAHGRRNANSIASFNKHLSVLERARPAGLGAPVVRTVGARTDGTTANPAIASLAGRDPSASLGSPRRELRPMTAAEAQKRRRDVVTGLVGFVVLAFATALLLGGIAFALFGVSVVLLGGYLGLLAYSQGLARERREKVHYLHTDDYDDYREPTLARSVN